MPASGPTGTKSATEVPSGNMSLPTNGGYLALRAFEALMRALSAATAAVTGLLVTVSATKTKLAEVVKSEVRVV